MVSSSAVWICAVARMGPVRRFVKTLRSRLNISVAPAPVKVEPHNTACQRAFLAGSDSRLPLRLDAALANSGAQRLRIVYMWLQLSAGKTGTRMAMERRYAIWDVFTAKPLAGNPLAVVLDSDGLTGQQMQAIAREFNLSETVFVLPPRFLPTPPISAYSRPTRNCNSPAIRPSGPRSSWPTTGFREPPPIATLSSYWRKALAASALVSWPARPGPLCGIRRAETARGLWGARP